MKVETFMRKNLINEVTTHECTFMTTFFSPRWIEQIKEQKSLIKRCFEQKLMCYVGIKTTVISEFNLRAKTIPVLKHKTCLVFALMIWKILKGKIKTKDTR